MNHTKDAAPAAPARTVSAMEAANAVKGLAQTCQKIITIGEALERIGSLEQAEQEAIQRTKGAQADAETATLRLAELKEAETAVANDAAARLESHKAEARRLLDVAHTESEKVLTAAAAKRAELEAQSAAEREAKSQAAFVALEQTRADERAARERLAEIEAEALERRKVLTQLDERVAATRAEIQRLLKQ